MNQTFGDSKLDASIDKKSTKRTLSTNIDKLNLRSSNINYCSTNNSTEMIQGLERIRVGNGLNRIFENSVSVNQLDP